VVLLAKKSLNNSPSDSIVPYALFVSFLAVFAIASMFLSFSGNKITDDANAVTGFAVEEASETNFISSEAYLCQDSDGGRNPKNYGEARAGPFIGTDSCRIFNPYTNKSERTTKCIGKGCFIQEVYCNAEQGYTKDVISIEDIPCSGRCNYGACDKVVEANLFFGELEPDLTKSFNYFGVMVCAEGNFDPVEVEVKARKMGAETENSQYLTLTEEEPCQKFIWYYSGVEMKPGDSAVFDFMIDPSNYIDETSEDDNNASTQVSRPLQSECTDTDLGFQPFQKGSVTQDFESETLYLEDKCVQKVKQWLFWEDYIEVSECSGDDCFVEEHECIGNGDEVVTGDTTKTSLVRCQDGCFEGACMPVFQPYCDEYDGGFNPQASAYIYSNAWGKTGRQADFCGVGNPAEGAIGGPVDCEGEGCGLAEFYCDGVNPVVQVVECSSCVQGTCEPMIKYPRPVCGNNVCEEDEAPYCPVCPIGLECPAVCFSGTCPEDCNYVQPTPPTDPEPPIKIPVVTQPAPQEPKCCGTDSSTCDFVVRGNPCGEVDTIVRGTYETPMAEALYRAGKCGEAGYGWCCVNGHDGTAC
jgi:hypothetical protein